MFPGRRLALAFAVMVVIAGLLFAGPRWPLHWPVAPAQPAASTPAIPPGSAADGVETPP